MAGLGRVTVSDRKSCWIGVLIAAPGGWSGYFAIVRKKVLRSASDDQGCAGGSSSVFEVIAPLNLALF